MGKLFHVLTIVLSAFHAVHQVEQDLGPGVGLSKKLQVIEKVGAVASTVGMALGIPVPGAALDAPIGGIINGIVALFNFFGIFKHAAPGPSAPTA